MSLLAPLAFVIAAVVVAVALRLTFLQFRTAALNTVSALRDCGPAREFRFSTVTVISRPATANRRRIATRKAAPEALRPAAGFRAAA